MIGLEKKENIIYLIDFGLSRRYRDSRTGEHIPYKEGKSILGTVRYVSIYTHFGIEQSRRDDIESLGYILVYLCKGILPWQGQKAKTQNEKYKQIMNMKLEYKPEMLCYGLPDEFKQFFEYIRGVQFTERPDYTLLKGLFNKALVKLDYVNDAIVSKEGRRNKKRGTLTQLEKELEERELEKNKTDIRRMLERKMATGENIKDIVKDSRMQMRRRS